MPLSHVIVAIWVDEAGRLSGLGVGVGSGLRVWMESWMGCDGEPVLSYAIA